MARRLGAAQAILFGTLTVGIELDSKGRLPIDDHFRIVSRESQPISGLYAIGDCIPGPMLAHKAEDDGVACVEAIVTGHCHGDYNLVPAVIFTHPEIAAVARQPRHPAAHRSTEDHLLPRTGNADRVEEGPRHGALA